MSSCLSLSAVAYVDVDVLPILRHLFFQFVSKPVLYPSTPHYQALGGSRAQCACSSGFQDLEQTAHTIQLVPRMESQVLLAASPTQREDEPFYQPSLASRARGRRLQSSLHRQTGSSILLSRLFTVASTQPEAPIPHQHSQTQAVEPQSSLRLSPSCQQLSEIQP